MYLAYVCCPQTSNMAFDPLEYVFQMIFSQHVDAVNPTQVSSNKCYKQLIHLSTPRMNMFDMQIIRV